VNDFLRIMSYTAFFGSGTETNTVVWTSKETRCYQLEYRTNLTAATPWVDASSVFAPDPGASTTKALILPGPPPAERYLRVEALKPLAP